MLITSQIVNLKIVGDVLVLIKRYQQVIIVLLLPVVGLHPNVVVDVFFFDFL